MTRDTALRKVTALLGSKAIIEARGDISSPEKREKAKATRQTVRSRMAELDVMIETRRRQLLDVPDYQAMVSERQSLRKRDDSLTGEQLHYKFQAGTMSGFAGFNAFHVMASGDTWEEVIAKLEAMKQAKTA